MNKIPWHRYRKKLAAIKDKPLKDLSDWLFDDLQAAVSQLGHSEVMSEILSYAPAAVLASFQCLAKTRLANVLAHIRACGDIGEKFVSEYQDAFCDEQLQLHYKMTPAEIKTRKQIKKTILTIIDNKELL